MRTKKGYLLAAAQILLLLAGCAGGGSSTGSPGGPNPSVTTISGVASKGLIKQGKVEIYAPASNGDLNGKILLKSTSTDSAGFYSANLGSYTGVVLVQVSGSYTDEATGSNAAVSESAPLRAAQVIDSSSAVSVSVTPLTELATRKALGTGTQLGASAVRAANALVSNLFQFDVVATPPVDPGVTAMAAASDNQRNYTLALAGISKLAASAGSVESVLGSWYGELAATERLSATSVNDFKQGVSDFLNDTTHNHTGVGSLPPGIAQVGYFTGTLYLYTEGQATAPITSLQTTLTLPAGVTLKKNGAGTPVVVTSGKASHAATAGLNYSDPTDSTPGVLTLAVIADPGFALGEFATVTYVAQPGVIPSASDFQISETQLFGFDGTVLFEIKTANVVPVLP